VCLSIDILSFRRLERDRFVIGSSVGTRVIVFQLSRLFVKNYKFRICLKNTLHLCRVLDLELERILYSCVHSFVLCASDDDIDYEKKKKCGDVSEMFRLQES